MLSLTSATALSAKVAHSTDIGDDDAADPRKGEAGEAFAAVLTALASAAGSAAVEPGTMPDLLGDTEAASGTGNFLPLPGKDAAPAAADGSLPATDASQMAMAAGLVSVPLSQTSQSVRPDTSAHSGSAAESVPGAAPTAAAPAPSLQQAPAPEATAASAPREGIAVSLDIRAQQAPLAAKDSPPSQLAATSPAIATGAIAAARTSAGTHDGDAERRERSSDSIPTSRAATAAPQDGQPVQQAATVPEHAIGSAPTASPDSGSSLNARPAAVTAAPPRFDSAEAVARVVDRLFEARSLAHHASTQISLDHADFGKIDLTFSHIGKALDVAVSASDGETQVALAAALQTADRSPQRDSSQHGSNAQGSAQGHRTADAGNGGGFAERHGHAASRDDEKRDPSSLASNRSTAEAAPPKRAQDRAGIYA